jgi:hypothetical protein
MNDKFYDGMIKFRPADPTVNFDIWYFKIQVLDI